VNKTVLLSNIQFSKCELSEDGVVLGLSSSHFEWYEVSVVRTLRNLAVFRPMFEWSETQERSVLNTIVH
jgi:hypothetical protein